MMTANSRSHSELLKDLGVWFDAKLSFNCHLNTKISEAFNFMDSLYVTVGLSIQGHLPINPVDLYRSIPRSGPDRMPESTQRTQQTVVGLPPVFQLLAVELRSRQQRRQRRRRLTSRAEQLLKLFGVSSPIDTHILKHVLIIVRHRSFAISQH